MAEPKLRVELFVCPHPDCRQVGKLPIGNAVSLKGWCRGQAGASHPKRRMEKRTFVEERPKVAK